MLRGPRNFRAISLAAAVFEVACKTSDPPSPPSSHVSHVYTHASRRFVEVELLQFGRIEVEDGVEQIIALGTGAAVPAYERATFVVPAAASEHVLGPTFWIVSPNSDGTVAYARSKLTNVSRSGILGAAADLLEQRQVETWRYDFKPHVGKVASRRGPSGELIVEVPPNLGPGRYIVTDRRQYFVLDLEGDYSRWREATNEAYLSKRYPFGVSAHLGASAFRAQAFKINVGGFVPITGQLRFGGMHPLTFYAGGQVALLNFKGVDKLASFSLFGAVSADVLWFTRHLALNLGLGAKLHSVGFMRTSEDEEPESWLAIGSLFVRGEFLIPVRKHAISIIYDRSIAATRDAQWHELGVGFVWRIGR